MVSRRGEDGGHDADALARDHAEGDRRIARISGRSRLALYWRGCIRAPDAHFRLGPRLPEPVVLTFRAVAATAAPAGVASSRSQVPGPKVWKIVIVGAGDKLYGPDPGIYARLCMDALTEADHEALLLPRQALHAHSIAFPHPYSGGTVQATAPLPPDMDGFWNGIPR